MSTPAHHYILLDSERNHARVHRVTPARAPARRRPRRLTGLALLRLMLSGRR